MAFPFRVSILDAVRGWQAFFRCPIGCPPCGHKSLLDAYVNCFQDTSAISTRGGEDLLNISSAARIYCKS